MHLDVGPNFVKAPLQVARACEAITAAADREGDGLTLRTVESELQRLSRLQPHMAIPSDIMTRIGALHDSLMMKPGSRDIRLELPALYSAYEEIGLLSTQVQQANTTISLGEISIFPDGKTHGLPSPVQVPKVDQIINAARSYILAFNALPEESALRGPFFR